MNTIQKILLLVVIACLFAGYNDGFDELYVQIIGACSCLGLFLFKD